MNILITGAAGFIGFHFCNKERFEDKPYCIEHCAAAYVIPEKEETVNKSDKVA